MEAARRRQVVLLVEGGPDYLVAAALARLGLVGRPSGRRPAASCPGSGRRWPAASRTRAWRARSG
ncbi:MAG: hypothetical protein R3F43_03185 [bacterium]